MAAIPRGGAVWADNGSITLLNDTIAGSSPVVSKATLGNAAVGGSAGLPGHGGAPGGATGAMGSGRGGGLFDTGGFFMTLKNTIVANNYALSNPDVSGAFTGDDHNLIGHVGASAGFGGSDFAGADQFLTALGNYGGPTQTMLPVTGPALDGGDDVVAPATDQRGIARPQGSHVDIGAVEVNNLTFTIISGSNQTTKRGKRFKPLLVQVTENGQPVPGLLVSFAVVPGSNGAAGKLSHAFATTNAAGQASTKITANSKVGSFTITARVELGLSVTFNLKNS
jgi:hypothetical protein